jgi:hypothetical protein
VSRVDAQKELEQQLEKSRILLLSGEPPGLLSALQNQFRDLSNNLYIISSIPEQCEEIFDVLVDGTTVVHVEIPRPGISQPLLLEPMSLQQYRRLHSTLSKLGRRRLEAAVKLAHQRQSEQGH